MLSLLTYGATFGVAERASTRHELDVASSTASPFGLDPGLNPELDPELDPETEQGQHATKGGVIGWLQRLIQRRT
jgi:hypothetical protein